MESPTKVQFGSGRLVLPEQLKPVDGAVDRVKETNGAFKEKHVRAVANFARRANFAEKSVLEIGGALPKDLVAGKLLAKQWVAVNYYGWRNGPPPDGVLPLAHATPRMLDTAEYQVFDGKAEALPDCFAERFDVVYSNNTFEHIHDIWKVLANAHMSLKRGGLLLSSFGPIWSGRTGHHVFISKELNFATFTGIPDYIHLTHSKTDCLHLVRDRYGQNMAEKFVKRAFFDPLINRLFVEDYVDAVEASPFETWKLTGWGVGRHSATLDRLRACVGDRVIVNGLLLMATR